MEAEVTRVRRITPAPRPMELVSVASIERGRGPQPGVFAPPYVWGDVLEGAPPRRRDKGEGAYSVFHDLELDVDTRITYTTIVSVDPGVNIASTDDDVIRVDSRVAVEHRLFLELIHKERAFMERVTARWRERTFRTLVRRRRFVAKLPYAWMRRPLSAALRVQARAKHRMIRAVRGTSQGIVQIPDSMFAKGMRVRSLMYGRLDRHALWNGLKDPRTLTTPEKSVILFLSGLFVLGTLFTLNNLIILAPELIPGLDRAGIAGLRAAYSTLVYVYLMGAATAALLPFPPSELLAVQAYYAAGPIVAFTVMLVSKVAGAWIVFFIGDTLNVMIRKQTAGKPTLTRLVAWMTRNSQRYGFWILTAFMTAPFLPDTLALYVFAVSGMTFRGFLGATIVGTSLRYGAVIWVVHYLGEARLHEILGM